MDAAFLKAIILIAETPASNETPGVHRDDEIDNLILIARDIVRREEKAIAAASGNVPLRELLDEK